ncbi:glycosyltransferase [Odoribacter lunatus]|uniref:glycosyltransferase n=1 Tax=Odoribacter lunatus TaxID=2941335 RepID=UPI0020405CBD|nr:glycosyltransferase [Odoribacter lunatus]
MRILQVIILSELGSVQSVVINLANKLIGEHEVIIAVGGKHGKMWKLLDDRIKNEYIKYLKRPVSILYDFLVFIQLIKLYFKYKPDIIHLHSSKIGLLGRLAFPKSKIVYTVHGVDSIRVAFRKFLPLEKFLQKRCHTIVRGSEYDKKLLCEGITNNVELVYNGGIIAP